MGRLADFLILLIAITGIFIMQFSAGQILVPLSDAIQDDGIDDKYDAGKEFGETIDMVTIWVPTVGLGGLVCVIVFREYRRQRIEAQRRL